MSRDGRVDEFGTEFPHGIGRVAKRELAANGTTSYRELTETTAHALLKIHGIGPRIAESVRLFFDQPANQKAVEHLREVGVVLEESSRPVGPAGTPRPLPPRP